MKVKEEPSLSRGTQVTFCVVPIGKFIFSDEEALKQKSMIQQALAEQGISYVGIDGVVRDGIVRSDEDARAVIEYFDRLSDNEKPDAMFIPHCNFGTETAVGILARNFRVPILLWGPVDDGPLPDGTRQRDSLCGVFASSKVLQNSGIPFTHLSNCSVQDPRFRDGVDRFLRAAAVVKRMHHGMRIGIVGNRLPFFQCTMINERELLEWFGIAVVPINLLKIVTAVRERERVDRDKYLREVKELGRTIDLSEMGEDRTVTVLAFRDVLLDLGKRESLDAITVENILELTEELDVHVVFALAEVTERGFPAVIESDIHGAISSVLLEAAGLGRSPTFFMDLTIRHPERENSVLLWHNSAPLALRDSGSQVVHHDTSNDSSDTQRDSMNTSDVITPSLSRHWTMPGLPPGVCNWKLEEGDVTVTRFERGSHGYRILSVDTRSVPGPYNKNTYVWVEVPDWNELEKKVVYGPYLHHVACIYGRYSLVFEEACRYLPGIEFDTC